MSVIERAKHTQEVLRKQRARLFKAFDIYKQNVNYGLLIESTITHNKLVNWYLLCLDLNYEAINNCPEELQKYL